MPLLNFKSQFADLVSTGVKRQTIRAKRKYPIKEGDTLYLYTGCRTKNARKLGEATCSKISQIEIGEGYVRTDGLLRHVPSAILPILAMDDGFGSFDDFMRFFRDTHGFPFHGQLIEWDELEQTEKP